MTWPPGANRYTLSMRAVQPAAVAVIVAGHDGAHSAQENITYAADRAYRIFRNAGIPTTNIRYLAPLDPMTPTATAAMTSPVCRPSPTCATRCKIGRAVAVSPWACRLPLPGGSWPGGSLQSRR